MLKEKDSKLFFLSRERTMACLKLSAKQTETRISDLTVGNVSLSSLVGMMSNEQEDILPQIV